MKKIFLILIAAENSPVQTFCEKCGFDSLFRVADVTAKNELQKIK